MQNKNINNNLIEYNNPCLLVKIHEINIQINFMLYYSINIENG